MSQNPNPNNLPAQPAILTATITVTRALTGKVETYQLIGTPVPQPEPLKED